MGVEFSKVELMMSGIPFYQLAFQEWSLTEALDPLYFCIDLMPRSDLNRGRLFDGVAELKAL